MGVRLLVGIADGSEEAAAMYDSVTGSMFGPMFTGSEAVEQAEKFLDWMGGMHFIGASEQIGLGPHDIPNPILSPDDPRAWPEAGLERLVSFWRSRHTDPDTGLLLEEDAPAEA